MATAAGDKRLPAGKTCKDCIHFPVCNDLLGRSPAAVVCWHTPNRFTTTSPPSAGGPSSRPSSSAAGERASAAMRIADDWAVRTAVELAVLLLDVGSTVRRCRRLEAAARQAIEMMQPEAKHHDATAECVVDVLTEALEARD